jgi:hypothetical protein
VPPVPPPPAEVVVLLPPVFCVVEVVPPSPQPIAIPVAIVTTPISVERVVQREVRVRIRPSRGRGDARRPPAVASKKQIPAPQFLG